MGFNYKEIFLPVNERYLNLEYYRIYISVLLTLIFYIYAIRKIFSKNYNNEQKIFLILPFAGMSLLLFQVVTGIPAQNWDPSKGDTLKPFYYSFLFVLSFSFLIIEIIKSLKKKYKIFLIISVFFLYIFIIQLFYDLISIHYNLYKREYVYILLYSSTYAIFQI